MLSIIIILITRASACNYYASSTSINLNCLDYNFWDIVDWKFCAHFYLKTCRVYIAPTYKVKTTLINSQHFTSFSFLVQLHRFCGNEEYCVSLSLLLFLFAQSWGGELSNLKCILWLVFRTLWSIFHRLIQHACKVCNVVTKLHDQHRRSRIKCLLMFVLT